MFKGSSSQPTAAADGKFLSRTDNFVLSYEASTEDADMWCRDTFFFFLLTRQGHRVDLSDPLLLVTDGGDSWKPWEEEVTAIDGAISD